MKFNDESAFQNYNELTTLPRTQLGVEQLQGMGRDQPSDLHPRRKPGRWKENISSTFEAPKIIKSCITFTHLCFECVAFAHGEMEERVSLSGARVHHCHQLVDAFPGNEGGEGGHLESERTEGKKSWDRAIPERQLCDRLSGQLSDQQQQVGEDSQDLRILVKLWYEKRVLIM